MIASAPPHRAPAAESIEYDRISYGQLRELRGQRGQHKEDTKAVLRTRLAATDAAKKKFAEGSSQDMDTSLSVLGKGARPMGETMATRTAADGNADKSPRSEALGIAFAGDLEVQKEYAQWRNPELKPQVEAHQSSVMGGVDGAVPAWVADECNGVAGQGLSPAEEEQHVELVMAAKIKELHIWRKFDVCGPGRD